MRFNKKIQAVISLLIMTVSMIGCSNQGKKEDNGPCVRGRYVESEVELPKLGANEEFVSMDADTDGYPILYTSTVNEDGKVSFASYRMDQYDKFTKEKISWTTNIKKESLGRCVPLQENGELEAIYYNTSKGKGYMGSISTKKNGQFTDTTLEDWEKDYENEISTSPILIAMADKHKIVYMISNEIAYYDLDLHKKLKSINYNWELGDFIVAGNGKLVVLNDMYENGTQKRIKVDVFREDELADKPDSFPMEVKDHVNSVGYINPNGDIIIANGEGIHVLENNSTIWETVVDGSLNSMYVHNNYCRAVTQTKQKDYYIFYEQTSYRSSAYVLMKYKIDPAIPAVPDKILTVYSLKDNANLYNAVLIYQRKHPDTKVEITIAMDDDQTVNVTDCIHTLNTQLLNHAGPDIIIGDGLPLDSYMEKGVLVDIKDIIVPMIEQHQILGNIAKTYETDGSYYTIPTRFTLPIMLAKPDALPIADSLTSIADYTQSAGKKKVFGRITYEDFLRDFVPVYYQDFIQSSKVDEKALAEFLKNIKILYENSGSIKEYPQNGWKTTNMELPKSGMMLYEECKGLLNLQIHLGICKVFNGGYQILNNSFIPSCHLSINKASKHVDMSKEFIQLLLSDEIQETVNTVAFPVNEEALKNLTQIQGYNFERCTTIKLEDGTSKVIGYDWLTNKEIENVIEQCKTVRKRVDVNEDVLNIMIEESKGYFQESDSVDDAVTKIKNKLNIYLSE